MSGFSRSEIVELLQIPIDEFKQTIVPQAKAAYVEARGNVIVPTAVMIVSNICRNTCLYCGMRAPNTNLKRFRLSPEEVVETSKRTRDMGFSRVFMISGEDMGYRFEDLLDAVRGAKAQGLFISLAAGVMTEGQFEQLRDTGVDEYVLKFEMADEVVFNRLHPSTNFKERFDCVRAVQRSGIRLVSGSILDYPGQTPGQLADDILMVRDLDVSWALNIPYRPAVGTPLAEEGGPGRTDVNIRHLAILRTLMPGINLNAQQTGRGEESGSADEQATLDSLDAGANILFYHLLPEMLNQVYNREDYQNAASFEYMRRISELSGMPLAF